MMLVLFSRPFQASMRGGVACGWIGFKDLPDLWPAGYRVRFHPTELIDPHGQVVAREGQIVSSGGGIVPRQPRRARSTVQTDVGVEALWLTS